MNFEFDQSGDIGILSFEGMLTANYRDDLRLALMMSIGSVNHIVLNFERVADIDPDCIQYLLRAVRTSRKLRKTVTLVGNHLKEASRKTLEECINGDCIKCESDCAPHTGGTVLAAEQNR